MVASNATFLLIPLQHPVIGRALRLCLPVRQAAPLRARHLRAVVERRLVHLLQLVGHLHRQALRALCLSGRPQYHC